MQKIYGIRGGYKGVSTLVFCWPVVHFETMKGMETSQKMEPCPDLQVVKPETWMELTPRSVQVQLQFGMKQGGCQVSLSEEIGGVENWGL